MAVKSFPSAAVAVAVVVAVVVAAAVAPAPPLHVFLHTRLGEAAA